jgi:hypothetical protein
VATLYGGASAFVAKFRTTDLFPLEYVSFSAPPGGSLELNGIGISRTGTVFVSGGVRDPAGPGYKTHLALSYDRNLVLRYGTQIDLGVESSGLAVDADRLGNSYHGGYAFNAPGRGNFVLRLNSAGTAADWTTSYVTDRHPNGGVHGVKLVPGAGAANGLYVTGTVANDMVNPGLEMILQSKLAPSNGASAYSVTGYTVGFNWGGRDVAVDDNGNAYAADNYGPPGGHNGEVFKWDPNGNFDRYNDFGASGFDDNAEGVDLVSGDPSSDVFFAGWTTTPEGIQYPPPSGCDVTYAGGVDGFLVKDNQPLPKLR